MLVEVLWETYSTVIECRVKCVVPCDFFFLGKKKKLIVFSPSLLDYAKRLVWSGYKIFIKTISNRYLSICRFGAESVNIACVECGKSFKAKSWRQGIKQRMAEGTIEINIDHKWKNILRYGCWSPKNFLPRLELPLCRERKFKSTIWLQFQRRDPSSEVLIIPFVAMVRIWRQHSG